MFRDEDIAAGHIQVATNGRQKRVTKLKDSRQLMKENELRSFHHVSFSNVLEEDKRWFGKMFLAGRHMLKIYDVYPLLGIMDDFDDPTLETLVLGKMHFRAIKFILRTVDRQEAAAKGKGKVAPDSADSGRIVYDINPKVMQDEKLYFKKKEFRNAILKQILKLRENKTALFLSEAGRPSAVMRRSQ